MVALILKGFEHVNFFGEYATSCQGCVVNKICKTCWRLKLIGGKKGPFCAVHYNNVKLHAFLREVVAAASASL